MLSSSLLLIDVNCVDQDNNKLDQIFREIRIITIFLSGFKIRQVLMGIEAVVSDIVLNVNIKRKL